MRRQLTLAAVLVSASLAARADTVTIAYSGLVGDQGGAITGNFQYNNSGPSVGGLFQLTSFSLTDLLGVNFGGPYTIPQATIGDATPGTVLSVPKTNGSILVGLLDMTYISPFGTSTFDLSFASDGSAGGVLSTGGAGLILSESYSASPVTYTRASVTPEPPSMTLLATGLLGVAGLATKRYV